MINGLIFYANIVWHHQGIILVQKETKLEGAHFLITFIAWLNLDFGIKACFSSGLNAYGKAWLQFLFPFFRKCTVRLKTLMKSTSGTAKNMRIASL